LATFTLPTGEFITNVKWGSGQFFAVGTEVSTIAGNLRVFSFNGSTITQLALFPTEVVSVLNWSPDGNYIVFNSFNNNTVFLNVVQFTGSSLLLQARNSFTRFGSSTVPVWSPLGTVIAFSKPVPAGLSPGVIFIFAALQFSQNTTILNNQISNVNGPKLPPGPQPSFSTGRGISASSGTNLIINNTGFDNDVNYIFVDNVFTQYLNNVQMTRPSRIANLSFPPL
jgi:Tol biopolymer transport system component